MKTYYFKTWFILLCFAVLTFTVSCSKDAISENVIEKPEAVSMAEEILQLVNTHRANIGKDTLSFDTLANDLVYDHTLYMIEQNDISHDDFDERADRLFEEGNANSVSENVAYGQRTAQAVMEAWLNSSGHRENIEGDFTHIGIAVVKNASGTYYFTQLFMKKRPEVSSV